MSGLLRSDTRPALCATVTSRTGLATRAPLTGLAPLTSGTRSTRRSWHTARTTTAGGTNQAGLAARTSLATRASLAGRSTTTSLATVASRALRARLSRGTGTSRGAWSAENSGHTVLAVGATTSTAAGGATAARSTTRTGLAGNSRCAILAWCTFGARLSGLPRLPRSTGLARRAILTRGPITRGATAALANALLHEKHHIVVKLALGVRNCGERCQLLGLGSKLSLQLLKLLRENGILWLNSLRLVILLYNRQCNTSSQGDNGSDTR